MATKEEQETTVTWASDRVVIYTAVPKHLRRLRSDKRASETRGGEDWGEFDVTPSLFDALNGFKRTRKKMDPAQREAAAQRLAAAREAKANKEES